jgi:hypothetical protein
MQTSRTSVQTCAICGKPMDAHDRQNYHIIKRATGERKHAHPECVTRDPAKARRKGFFPRVSRPFLAATLNVESSRKWR